MCGTWMLFFTQKKIVQTCNEARTLRLVISNYFLKYVSLTLTYIKNKIDFLYFILSYLLSIKQDIETIILSCTSLLSKIMSLSLFLFSRDNNQTLFYIFNVFIFSINIVIKYKWMTLLFSCQQTFCTYMRLRCH